MPLGSSETPPLSRSLWSQTRVNNTDDPTGADTQDLRGLNGSLQLQLSHEEQPAPDLASPAVAAQPWLHVCVLVVKEDSGFGMTVTGDNPVYVEYVRPDGAAAKAGVMQGDRIAKVNGVLVINSNHTQVVNLIKASSSVALTLLRKPADAGQRLAESASKSPLRMVITDPIAATGELEQSVARERISNLQRMLEQAREDEERAKADFAKNKTQKNSDRWTEARKTLESVEQQLQAASSQLLQPSGGSACGGSGSYTEASTPLPPLMSVQAIPGSSANVRSAASIASTTVNHRRFDMRQARRSNSVASFGSSSSPTSPSLTATVAYAAEEPSHRVSTRVASQNIFMASSADVTDCNAVVLPPPVVMVPGTDEGLVSITTGTDDQELQEQPETQAQVCSYGASSFAVKGSLPSSNSSSGLAQVNIISMEDDEFPAEQQAAIKDHGPFNELEQLKKRHAHCAVFLSYLVSNGDPSAFLLHLMIDGYMQGNLKEMRKWAYEIYSAYIAEESPLQVKMDESIVQTIESTMEKKSDKEETMRSLFIPARNSCLADLMINLADFRSKRDLGLGNLFGDGDLYDDMDRAAELRVVEKHLGRLYAQFRADTTPRGECMCFSLVALIREWGIMKPNSATGLSVAALEKTSSFLVRDRSSFKDILSGKVGKVKKEVMKNHAFLPQTYHARTHCEVCDGILWGAGVQGLQCQVCDMNVHRDCLLNVETCQKKRRPRVVPAQDGNSRRKHALVPTAPPVLAPLPGPSSTSGSSDKEDTPLSGLPSPSRRREDDSTTSNDVSSHSVDRLVERFERSHSTFAANPQAHAQPKQYQEPVNPEPAPVTRHVRARSSVEPLDVAAAVLPSSVTAAVTAALRPAAAAVSRSGSFNEKSSFARSELMQQLVKNIRVSRSDVDQDRGAALEAITSDAIRRRLTASASSLSDRSDSDLSETASGVSSQTHGHRSAVQQQQQQLLLQQSMQQCDSDLEVELEMPSIENVIPREQLRKLKPKEKKRQEIINELFYTERSHVRNLKILDKLFHAPMAAEPSISPDLVKLVFSNISDVIIVHCSMNNAMRLRQKENAVVEKISDILLARFEGKAGEVMKEACAEFCKNHTLALETLKARRRKDSKLQEIIQAAESSPFCRRLQLHDLLIAEVHRLTKYPLLIRSLVKHMPAGEAEDALSGEREALENALLLSEDVLAHVNSAIKECEDRQTLLSLQRRLDTSPLEKSNGTLTADIKNLDLTKHRLICEGNLTWRLANRKFIAVRGVLLESMLVLLQIHDDGRLLLAYQDASASTAATLGGGKGEDSKLTHSPVLQLNAVLARQVATDKKAFFIISTADTVARIYELAADTAEERKRWFKYITDAAETQRKQPVKSVSPSVASGRSAAGEGSTSGETGNGLAAGPVPQAASASMKTEEASGYFNKDEECDKSTASQESPERSCADVTDSACSPLPADPQTVLQQNSVALAQRLQEKNAEIHTLTEEKRHLIADAMKLASSEKETGLVAASVEQERDPKVLILAAMSEVMQVTSILNGAAGVADLADAKGKQLTITVENLNKRLNRLLDVIVEKDVEDERLRDQLRRAQQMLSLNGEACVESPTRLSPPCGPHKALTTAGNGSRPQSPGSSVDHTSAYGRSICDSGAEAPTALKTGEESEPKEVSISSSCSFKQLQLPYGGRSDVSLTECSNLSLSRESSGSYGLFLAGPCLPEAGSQKLQGCHAPATGELQAGQAPHPTVRFVIDSEPVSVQPPLPDVDSATWPVDGLGSGTTSLCEGSLPTAAFAAVHEGSPSAADQSLVTAPAFRLPDPPPCLNAGSREGSEWGVAMDAVDKIRWNQHMTASEVVAALLCSEDDSEV